MNASDIKTLLQAPIAFHPIFSKITGGVAAGVFLSQLHYWSNDRGMHEEGWIYKKNEEWQAETTLSSDEIRAARRALKELHITKEAEANKYFSHIHKFDKTLCFRLDYQRLIEAINSYQQHQNDPQTRVVAECRKSPTRAAKIPSSSSENSQLTNTKSTSKNTESSSALESTTTTTFSANQEKQSQNPGCPGVKTLPGDDSYLQNLIKLSGLNAVNAAADSYQQHHRRRPLCSQLEKELIKLRQAQAKAVKAEAEAAQAADKASRAEEEAARREARKCEILELDSAGRSALVKQAVAKTPATRANLHAWLTGEASEPSALGWAALIATF